MVKCLIGEIYTKELPQGSVINPLFFIFINDLPVGIISLCEIFADDTPLFSKVYDTDISAKELNSNLEKNSQWAFQWKIQFNPDPICKQSYFF